MLAVGVVVRAVVDAVVGLSDNTRNLMSGGSDIRDFLSRSSSKPTRYTNKTAIRMTGIVFDRPAVDTNVSDN